MTTIRPLTTSEIHALTGHRTARYLRWLCAGYRVDPPTLADIGEYISVALDVAEQWLDDYIGEREAAAEQRCLTIYATLERLGCTLDPADHQDIAFCAEDARFASPTGPRPLVLVTHDGTAIVADLAAGAVHHFGVDRTPRWRRILRRAI